MNRIYIRDDLRSGAKVKYERFYGLTFHRFKIGDCFRKRIRTWNDDERRYRNILVICKVVDTKHSIIVVDMVG